MNQQHPQMFTGFEKKPINPKAPQPQKKQKIINKIGDFFSNVVKNRNFSILFLVILFSTLVFLYEQPTADFIMKEIKRSNEQKQELNKSILDLRDQKAKLGNTRNV